MPTFKPATTEIAPHNDTIKSSQRCVITLGISSPPYRGHPPVLFQNFSHGIDCLQRDLRETEFSGAVLYWDKQYPVGCPVHSEVPFAFKPACFEVAAQKGFSTILWLDSSIRLKRGI